MKNKIEEIKRLVDASSKVAIFGHEYIDGDCIGSCFALGSILKKINKEVSYFVSLEPSPDFAFFKELNQFKTEFDYADYDLLIFCDVPDYNRIGRFYTQDVDYFHNKKKIVIDHHSYHDEFGDLNIIDDRYSSTCEILSLIFVELWENLIDTKIATYLYYGIVYDTGNFIYDCTTSKTFEVINNLIRFGADRDFANKAFVKKNTYNSIKFNGLLINRLERKGNMAYTYFTYKEMEEYGIYRDQCKYILEILHTVVDLDLVLVVSQVTDGVKCSIRTTSSLSHILAAVYESSDEFIGGGGSAHTSGFKLKFKGNLEEQLQEIVDKVNNYYLELIKDKEVVVGN